MDRPSAKQVPILDSLVDTPAQASKVSSPPAPETQAKREQPASASTNGTESETPTTPQNTATLNNRFIDKSQFEIEVTKIVKQTLNKYLSAVSEEIVQQVLHQVRARLPGQRKN